VYQKHGRDVPTFIRGGRSVVHIATFLRRRQRVPAHRQTKAVSRSLREAYLRSYLSGSDAMRLAQGHGDIKDMEASMRATQAVLDNHLKSFGAGNLDGILSDYAANAILFTPDGALKGPGEIKPLFERLLAEFAKPGASFSMKTMSVDGDYAYIIWSAQTAENVYELATDTFVVRNGKIVVQSFAGKITPRN
jgi:hypothetical protein